MGNDRDDLHRNRFQIVSGKCYRHAEARIRHGGQHWNALSRCVRFMQRGMQYQCVLSSWGDFPPISVIALLQPQKDKLVATLRSSPTTIFVTTLNLQESEDRVRHANSHWLGVEGRIAGRMRIWRTQFEGSGIEIVKRQYVRVGVRPTVTNFGT